MTFGILLRVIYFLNHLIKLTQMQSLEAYIVDWKKIVVKDK
jgi:hypothetical protein